MRILRPAKSSGVLTGFFASTLRRSKIIGPGDDPDVAALQQRVLDRLGGAGVKRLGLLWKAREEIAGSKVPTSGTRLAEIDEPDTIRSITQNLTELMTSISCSRAGCPGRT